MPLLLAIFLVPSMAMATSTTAASGSRTHFWCSDCIGTGWIPHENVRVYALRDRRHLLSCERCADTGLVWSTAYISECRCLHARKELRQVWHFFLGYKTQCPGPCRGRAAYRANVGEEERHAELQRRLEGLIDLMDPSWDSVMLLSISTTELDGAKETTINDNDNNNDNDNDSETERHGSRARGHRMKRRAAEEARARVAQDSIRFSRRIDAGYHRPPTKGTRASRPGKRAMQRWQIREELRWSM